MKVSIFRASFFSTQLRGSKPFTSAAIWQSIPAGSNLVIRPAPDTPPLRAAQKASIPMPMGETAPSPVTTTRRFTPVPLSGTPRARPSRACGGGERRAALRPVLDVLDRGSDGQDLFRLLIGDLQAELLLQGHHQLDGVQGVRAQVLDELRLRIHLRFLHPELLHDDLLDLLLHSHGVPHLLPGVAPRRP